MTEADGAATIEWIYGVEKDDCIRCASCTSLAPEIFRVDDAGMSIIRQPCNQREVNQCEAAVINCPTNAVKKTWLKKYAPPAL